MLVRPSRESGCLTADTRLVRADTGAEVTLGELVGTDPRLPIWSLDERYRLVPARLLPAFPSGVKPTFRLRLASGRSVDASANHPFLTSAAGARSRHSSPVSTWRPHRTSPARRSPTTCRWPSGSTCARSRLPPPGCRWPTSATSSACATPSATLERFRLTRHRVARIAAATGDDWLEALAAADVVWDRIMSVTPLGEQPVFDATIETTHNFVANGIVAHNSLEQDADVVMFLYRDEVYNNESPDKGSAEVIVAKHRSGPIGTKRLVFRGQYTRFDNAARGV